MSIFTSKADADLPILTKVYQIDPDNYDEIGYFFQLWDDTSYLPSLFEDVYPAVVKELRLGRWDAVSSQIDSYDTRAQAFIRSFLEARWFCAFVTRILHGLAIEKALRAKDIESLNDYFFLSVTKYEQSYKSSSREQQSLATENSLVSLDDIGKFRRGGITKDGKHIGFHRYHYFLTKELELVVALTLDNYSDWSFGATKQKLEKKYLSVCDECGSVFVLTHQDSTYCSHRCAARAGERRRRQQKKLVNTKQE